MPAEYNAEIFSIKNKNQMKALKVFTAVFAVFAQLLILIPSVNADNVVGTPGEKRKLMVTAYYSPLPNQSFYIRGSYEADIKLNGRGTNGADGTQVYPGMIAAPKTYPFGTRVKIPGLGVGEVHDRGGAIFAHKDYDRIDVWMGQGEEGLARALNWGARLVEGEVFFTADHVEPGLSFNWVDSDLPARFVAKLKGTSAPVSYSSSSASSQDLNTGSKSDAVRELQENLTQLGYYKGPVTGYFGNQTRDAVLAFQLGEGIITSPSSKGAGNFGPQTRAHMQQLLAGSSEPTPEEAKEIERLEQNRAILASGLGKDARGDDVVNLQRMLWELGYYNGPISGVYDAMTIDAVFTFQVEHDVLKNQWDRGAGYFGKKTLAALSEALDRKMQRLSEFPKEYQVWVPAKRDLPQIASLELPEIAEERQALHFSQELMGREVAEALSAELDLNDRSQQVAILQNILIQGGYLAQGLNTGYYGQLTQDAVYKFQLDKGIVEKRSDPGAGRVGPKTLTVLNSF